MNQPTDLDAARPLFQAHPRDFRENRYVYPVLSRRAGGISIGVNLNLDKACNFDCIYCQVDRTAPGEKQSVDLDRLVAELEAMVDLVNSGRLYQDPKFRQTPSRLRRLCDIALSGDGEPTTCRIFERVVAACADVRRRGGLDDVKLVLITNASMFHRAGVRRGLEILDANGGEIWAKLDAGTDDYCRRVVRSAISFRRILENLRDAARARPIVVQSLFMRIDGQSPPAAEQQAYCERLCEIAGAGGRIKLVQLYTVARPPAESCVTPLSNDEIDAMAALVRQTTGLPVDVFYGMKPAAEEAD
ncbi:MAG: radical SAM protein [Planctomycetota bacterium]|jgi:wyosine [tRNA(Phe)-imidazoG37] synthetase (radical SAM superfamily)